jgi:MOSC domain-containing protein YiiM
MSSPFTIHIHHTKRRIMTMTVTIQIGQPKAENFYGREYLTGICKQPVEQALFLGQTGFEGDGVGNRKHHGGRDKAVCAYSADHYAHWEEMLGITMPLSAFGENLTISGLTEEGVCIGDIFQLGEARIQVSQPRQPCSTLAARYGRSDFVKVVVDSGYTGWYFRVLQTGMVGPEDNLILREHDELQVTVAFANRLYHYDRSNRQDLERILAVEALSESWRKALTKSLVACNT